MPRYYQKTFTVSVATPAVFTCTDHGLEPGDEVILETTGALPTGLTVKTITYFIIRNGFTTSTFQVSTNETKSFTGSAVNTTGTQSGAHTFLKINHASLQPFVSDTE